METHRAPHNFWKSRNGRSIIKHITSGELSPAQAATDNGLTPKAIQEALSRFRRGILYRSHPRVAAAQPPTRHRGSNWAALYIAEHERAVVLERHNTDLRNRLGQRVANMISQ